MDRADHPRRGAHLRHGPVLRARTASTPASASSTSRSMPSTLASLPRGEERPDPGRRHHRGRVDVVVHRGRHGLRHARRADDPVLHLLLDVRLPAHRRPDLGRRRHAHAAASCSARTAGRTTLNGEGLQHEDGHSHVLASTVPNLRGLRPGLRLRAGRHHPGRHPPDVRGRRGRLLLHHALQRELPDAADAGGRGRGHPARACTSCEPAPIKTQAARRSTCSAAARSCRTCCGRRRCSPSSSAWPPTSGASTSYKELRREALDVRALEPAAPDARRRGKSYVETTAGEGRGRLRRGQRLHEVGAGDDRPLGAGRPVPAGHRRLRPQRRPRGAAAAFRGGRRVHHRRGAGPAGAAQARSSRRRCSRRSRSWASTRRRRTRCGVTSSSSPRAMACETVRSCTARAMAMRSSCPRLERERQRRRRAAEVRGQGRRHASSRATSSSSSRPRRAPSKCRADAGGKVAEVLVKKGDEVKVGQVLRRSKPAAANGRDRRRNRSRRRPPEAEAAARSRSTPAHRRRRATVAEAAAAPQSPAAATAATASRRRPRSATPALVPAGPATRRLARELGVDLGRVAGTGPRGRVTQDDVNAFSQQVAGRQPAAAAASPRRRCPTSRSGARSRAGRSTPSAARRPSRWPRLEPDPARHAARPGRHHRPGSVPQVAAGGDGPKLTVTAFALKAAAIALKEFPHFNASLDLAGGQLILKRYYHIGVAVDTERGLLVPVLRDVDKKSVRELAAEVDRRRRARPASGSCRSTT